MSKKTTSILAVVTVAIIAVIFGLCALNTKKSEIIGSNVFSETKPVSDETETTEEAIDETKAKIIDIDVSDEAKAKAVELMSRGDAASLEEGVFDAIVPPLYERGEQKLPEYETENEHGSFKLDDTNVYTLGNDESENIILYIHGGAWTFEIDEVHVRFCDKLATSMNAKVYMPLYPLAPQYNYEDTYELIYKLYAQLAAEGKDIFVMGDSAGGNITLGLMHLLKEKGDEMPKAIVPLSPCADMTFSNPEMKEIEKDDPSLRVYGCKVCAELWADEKSLDDPLLSAVNADVSGYPKTMIFFGTHDILYPDGMILYDKLSEAGVEVTFVRAEGLYHVYPLGDTPECEDTIKMITEFCK